MTQIPTLLVIFALTCTTCTRSLWANEEENPPGLRVTRGLSVLYDFREIEKGKIADRSGVGRSLDLNIKDLSAVKQTEQGLVVLRPTLIGSLGSSGKIYAGIQRGGALTLEAWIRPAKIDQSGPARILTLSQDSSNRNLTLGQDKNRLDIRLRTTKTNRNGIPSTATPDGSLKTELTHVVYVRERGGRTIVYLDGEKISERTTEGSLSNWDTTYTLALADEHGGGRAWLGTYGLIALYSRALSHGEVQQNFRAGSRGRNASEQQRDDSQFFVANVAPLLAEHCLECHDAPNRAGGLDLAHRRTALAGGDTGPAIVPGDAEQSALLASVLSGEMPLDRPALSPEEIETLKIWISRGATWSLDFVDPALFVHGGESTYFIQRLTTDEYIATVKTTFDVDISEEARKQLPKDLRADGFVNTAYNLQVDLKHVESYARLAEIIVSKMDVQAFAKRFTKRLRFTDKDIGALIENMGMWILRGPLDEREVIAYRGISTTVASAGGSYEEAVGLLIEAMIQSPRFVYRMENQAGDGSQWPVNQWELASRMSYILWGSSPDAALHKVAKSGEIFDPAVQAQHVDRMLDDPRARERALEFARQWLNLSALDNLQPDSQRFPGWNSRLASDMQQESLAFFEEVAWNQDRRLSDLLSAQVTFVSPELAKHYRLRGTARPWEGRPGWLRYDLHDDSSRGGLLTQGSVLTVGGDNASMVTRGLFVMHDLMRGVVKDPPPCVDATPVPSKAGLTQRMIAMERIENESCGGCHAKFEPLAFGLERFDGLGAYAEQDQFGNELRDDGEVLFPGQADSLPYENAQQLMQLLADSERVQQSLTWKLVQFAVGRPLAAKDATVVDRIHRRASSAGGTYRDLIKEIVRSDLVQLTQTESNSEG